MRTLIDSHLDYIDLCSCKIQIMLVLTVLFISVVVANSYLFFAPFYLEINTSENMYRIRFHRLSSIRIRTLNTTLVAEFKIGPWKKTIDLFQTPEIPKTKPIKAKNKIHYHVSAKKMKAILKSFKITHCTILLDFGDDQLNGILFPLFYLLNRRLKQNISINFVNQNKIDLQIKNSLARIGWAYLTA